MKMIYFVIIPLAVLTAVLLAAYLISKRNASRLAGEIEDYLISGKKPSYSVKSGDFSRLHNDVCDLCDALEVSRQNNARDNAKNADFVADVSHQLKTPLAGIRLYCEMRQNEAPSESGEKELMLLDKTEKLVFELLRLQKLKADAYEMTFSLCSLAGVVSSAVQPFRELFPGKNISVSGDAEIRCDPHWLIEAVGNIVKNACEHTAEDGEISIVVEPGERSAEIRITDNGGGVKDGETEHLFDRFYKSEGSSPQSTGIGLSIAKEIISRHHGIITADNTGTGLRIDICLPVIDGNEKIT